ncbi:hypothetical protein Tco_1088358, partial [Tanacetum coccineum]
IYKYPQKYLKTLLIPWYGGGVTTGGLVTTAVARKDDGGGGGDGYGVFNRLEDKEERSCKKKVIREKDMIDLEAEMPKKSASAIVDKLAYHLCHKYSKGEQNDHLPAEIKALTGKKYAFKVSIDAYNVKKLLPVFTVLRLSDDPKILDSIRVVVTLNKMDTEATSSSHHVVTPLVTIS